jgi:hypothetical protein
LEEHYRAALSGSTGFIPLPPLPPPQAAPQQPPPHPHPQTAPHPQPLLQPFLSAPPPVDAVERERVTQLQAPEP